MRAAWYDQFGEAPEVLRVGELPDPEPGPHQVVVALHTSAVNPSDVRKRAGAFPDLLDHGPIIPHSDGAGVIEAVGEDCLLYTSPSPRDRTRSRMPSSA